MQEWPGCLRQRATCAGHGDLGGEGRSGGYRTAWHWGPALGLSASAVQVARTAGPLRVAVVRLWSLLPTLESGQWPCAGTCALVMVTRRGTRTVSANSGAARASVSAHMAGVSRLPVRWARGG